MARKQKYVLPSSVEIEVVAVKGKESVKKNITLSEIATIKKKKGWKYYFFQLGYSQFNK